MPMYEFKCGECDSSFEEIIACSKIDEVTCPSCGSGKPEKQLSAFATVGDSGGGHAASSGGCGGGSGFS